MDIKSFFIIPAVIIAGFGATSMFGILWFYDYYGSTVLFSAFVISLLGLILLGVVYSSFEKKVKISIIIILSILGTALSVFVAFQAENHFIDILLGSCFLSFLYYPFYISKEDNNA